MAGTRSSARHAGGSNSKPASQTSSYSVAGTKRKAEAAPTTKSKRGRKPKQQKTLEETMPNVDDDSKAEDPEPAEPKVEAEEASKDKTGKAEQEILEKVPEGSTEEAMDTAPDNEAIEVDESQTINESTKAEEATKTNGAEIKGEDTAKQDATKESTTNGDSSQQDRNIKTENMKSQLGHATANGTAVDHSHQREESTPSSILEKGIVYFFFRGRVGIDEPSQVDDIARSYIVLRPLPHGAKLGEGAIGDAYNNRLLVLPKKVLPLSGRDRFMVFVEKANASMDEIKSGMGASDYATKTAGTRHTPAMAPIGEGVYAITTTGRESHLAYMMTIPSELSEVQLDVGLREQGSFVVSVKNPQYEGPANTNLPKGPDFTKE